MLACMFSSNVHNKKAWNKQKATIQTEWKVEEFSEF